MCIIRIVETLLICGLALLLSNVVHHWLVIPYDLLPSLAFPIDAGRRFRDRPLFGTQKTARGLIVISALTALFTYTGASLSGAVLQTHPVLLGFLLGVFYMLGELPNSFLKRQAGVPESRSVPGLRGLFFSVFDHADSMLFASIALYLLEEPSFRSVTVFFSSGVMLHIFVNMLLRARGYKRPATAQTDTLRSDPQQGVR